MARAKLREIAEASLEDPKQALLDSLGDISGLRVYQNRVLVATYIRPSITQGGIHLPDKTLQEDRFQGKVGIIVKMGARAFKYDEFNCAWDGDRPQLHDWVWYRPGDGFELFSVDKKDAGTSCRVFYDHQLHGDVNDPSLIW